MVHVWWLLQLRRVPFSIVHTGPSCCDRIRSRFISSCSNHRLQELCLRQSCRRSGTTPLSCAIRTRLYPRRSYLGLQPTNTRLAAYIFKAIGGDVLRAVPSISRTVICPDYNFSHHVLMLGKKCRTIGSHPAFPPKSQAVKTCICPSMEAIPSSLPPTQAVFEARAQSCCAPRFR
jgi:hypothetical protein